VIYPLANPGSDLDPAVVHPRHRRHVDLTDAGDERRFAAMEVRALTGAGAEKVVAH